MRFPKYLLATNSEAFPDEEIIISTEKPYYASRVMKFKQTYKAVQFMSSSDHLIKFRIPGYDIFLYFVGSIEGSRVELTSDYQKRITAVLNEMAHFYMSEKQATKPYIFSKYKTGKDEQGSK